LHSNKEKALAESHLKIAVKKIKRDKLAVAGFCVICLFMIIALLDTIPLSKRNMGGVKWDRTALDALFGKEVEKSYSPSAKVVFSTWEFSSSRHLLGTNNLGEDVF
jgi:ABC-type dipeptide/oligopeptide/nickel transport system permease subunit